MYGGENITRKLNILLLIILLSISNNSFSIFDGKILYVGGEGEGNYTTIQEAINNAMPGDTIFVYSGVYEENITITKPRLTLIGEDRNATIITGKVSIKADFTTVRNFTLKGFSIYSSKNVIEQNVVKKFMVLDGIKGVANENLIRNNVLYDIQLGQACYNRIENNTINGCIDIIFDADNNMIYNNTISKRMFIVSAHEKIINNRFIGGGISIGYGEKEDYIHEIVNNTVNGRPLYYFYKKNNITITGEIGDIILVDCENITIENATAGFENYYITNLATLIFCKNITIKNTAFYNFFYAVEVRSSRAKIENCFFKDGRAILLDNADGSIVRNNVIKDSGMGIGFHATDYAIVENNYIEGKGKESYRYGLYIGAWYDDDYGNKYNICRNNTIKNFTYGIFIFESSNNFIINNSIESCETGIFIQYLADENEIRENLIANNEKGIVIEKLIAGEYKFYSDNNKIFYNKFIGNTLNAFDNCSNIWCDGCVGNYWDDYNGRDKDGDGIGDLPYTIPGEGNKDYAPLMQPYEIFVKIKKPSRGIYIFERKAIPLPFDFSIIVGKIKAEASAFGVKKIEFYLNNELKHIDDSYPYVWEIKEKGLFTFKIKGYGKEIREDEIKIWII